jgi:signal transduction histidine kinase
VKNKSIFNSLITAYIVVGTVIIVNFLMTVVYGYMTTGLGENGFAKGSILFLICAAVDIIFLSYWTYQKIRVPLLKITEGITKIFEDDYNSRIELNGQKDFEVIRDSFNLLAEKLQASQKENLRIQEDRTRMLLDLAHDIKTPICTIQYFSKALSEGLVTDEDKRQRYYNTIYSKGKRVSELIDDLFEYVKFDSKNYNLNIKISDFSEFIRLTVAEFYDEIEEKGLNLELNIAEGETMLEFDELLMRRVISNIINNAIKYNESGTNLRIELKQAGTGVLFEIGDNGSGIPEIIKDKVFEPFIRGDESRKSDGGAGLGLAISKRIIESHGGSLELKSDYTDEKTVFTIKLNKRISSPILS